jgi:hypothetical protein
MRQARTSRRIGDHRAGCSKRPSSKAAASEGPEAYPLGYVEGLNDARTTLADFFSILLRKVERNLIDLRLEFRK